MSNLNKGIQKGMILYTIEKDGCLNGIYTNEHPAAAGSILNEITKKSDTKPDDLEGTYLSAYFESDNGKVTECKLAIDCKSIPYRFVWYKNNPNNPIWEGYGYKMRENLLAVHYWASKS